MAAAMTLGAQVACATTFELTPRDLGRGFSFTGSITTDSTVGALTVASITDWNIQVSAVNDFAESRRRGDQVFALLAGPEARHRHRRQLRRQRRERRLRRRRHPRR